MAVDTETTGLNFWKGDRPFAISICSQLGKTRYYEFPVNPQSRGVAYQADMKKYEEVKKLLTIKDMTYVFHNASFDLKMLAGIGIFVSGRIEDTSIAAHVYNSLEPSYALKKLCIKYCDMDDDDQKALQQMVVRARREGKKLGYNLGEAVEQDYWLPSAIWGSDSEEAEFCKNYAGLDAERTAQLWMGYNDQFEKDRELKQSYEFEMRELFPVLENIESVGIRIDLEENERQIRQCQKNAASAMRLLRQLSENPDFNPNSPKQVSKLLFEDQGLTPTEFTGTGHAKTGKDVLDKYSNHDVVKQLLRFRSNDKGITSFFGVYKEKAVDDPAASAFAGDLVKCIHPNFRQGGKKTGRLSVTDPNLQGVASSESSRAGSQVVSARRPFCPRPGCVLLLADYSQLESRIFGSLSNTEVLLEAFARGKDLHTETANRAWGGKGNPRAVEMAQKILKNQYPTQKWTFGAAEKWLAQSPFHYNIVIAEASLGKKTVRSNGKTMFFARMFGAGPYRVAEEMGISVDEARDYLNDFDNAVPGLSDYVQEMSEVGQQGYITTAYGRRLNVEPDYLYRGASYAVQGTAADLIKRVMVTLSKWLRKLHPSWRILLQIHDELIFEGPEKEMCNNLLKGIKKIMEDHDGKIVSGVPVKLEVARETWAKSEEIEV